MLQIACTNSSLNHPVFVGVVKVKKIACIAVKGRGVNSGLRLIYAYFEVEQKITFTELYHKKDKENEDKHRILNNFK